MRTKQLTTKPRTEPRTEPRTAAPASTGIGLAVEWFLELPGAVVLAVMWVVGMVFMGACALLIGAYVLLTYVTISAALVSNVAGAF
jgi:hypothetical protein